MFNNRDPDSRRDEVSDFRRHDNTACPPKSTTLATTTTKNFFTSFAPLDKNISSRNLDNRHDAAEAVADNSDYRLDHVLAEEAEEAADNNDDRLDHISEVEAAADYGDNRHDACVPNFLCRGVRFRSRVQANTCL